MTEPDNIWGDKDWCSSRDRPAWERNTVSVVEHLGNPEGFAWAMLEQTERQIEAWQDEVGPDVPWWLWDKLNEWRAKWRAANAKSSNVMSDIVSQLQAKGASK